MKFHLSLLFIGVLALLSACKKDASTANNNNNGTPVSYKVKFVAYTDGQSRDTTVYTYDAQDRIIAYANHSVTSSFTISGNSMSILFSMLPGSLDGTLDANGRIVHIYEQSFSGYPGYDEFISYDATGALVADSSVTNPPNGGSPIPNTPTLFTWADSNLVSVAPAGGSAYYTCTYLTDREYRENGFRNSDYFPIGTQSFFSGRHPKNLLHVETRINSGLTFTTTHSYVLDAHGRVATETVVADNGGQGTTTSTYTFTYY